MQKSTYSDYPERKGVIQSFISAPTEYLMLIAKDLSLKMPIGTLSAIQSHFKFNEKRDIFVEELIMLDILWQNAKCRAINERNLLLAELSTEDEDIKDTFWDITNKLFRLNRGQKGPIALCDILDTPSKYLISVMPERYFDCPEILGFGKDDPKLAALSEGKLPLCEYSVEGKKFLLAEKKDCKKFKQGVYIQIEKSPLFPDLISVLQNHMIDFSSKVIKHNVIEEILEEGVHGEISAPFSLITLADFGEGDLLLLCNEKDESMVAYIGTQMGLRMRRAGRKLKKGNLRFITPSFTYELSGDFLRRLTAMKITEAVNVNVKNEESLLPECVLEKVEKLTEDEIGGHSLFSAKSEFRSPYIDGIAQVVASAASAVAAGSPISHIKLKSIVNYPISEDYSPLVANILGICRAETELCLFSHKAELNIEANISADSRTLAIGKKTDQIPVDTGELWIVSPDHASKRICFESIRRTFAYMTALLSSGNAIRACYADGDERCSDSIGSFLVLSKIPLAPAEGVLTEKIGMVGMEQE